MNEKQPKYNFGQQLPNAKESEELVLGTIMAERNAYSEVKDLLTEDVFYFDKHKEIFRNIKNVVDDGDRPDSMTVYNEMRKTNTEINPYELMLIAEKNTFDLYQHAAIIYDKAKRRKFFEIGNYLLTNCHSEETDIVDVNTQARTMLENLDDLPDNQIKSIIDVAEQVYTQIDLNLTSSGKLTGSDTGFQELNSISGGFQKSDLIIIAGESSQGKTAFMLSLARNMANAGAKMAIYSLEMRNTQLLARLLAMETGVPSNQILYTALNEDQIQKIDKGVSKVSKSEIYFDDRSTSNIDTIISSIRTMKIKRGIDGAIIDYLQILNVNMKGSNKEQQMADVARRLKNLAKELDIWIVALSQLNRDNQNPVPNLNRLRDSGQIAEAADIVMFVYRPEYYGKKFPEPFQSIEPEGMAMIDVAKGRSIGIKKFLCSFTKETTLFSETSELKTIEKSKENDPF